MSWLLAQTDAVTYQLTHCKWSCTL